MTMDLLRAVQPDGIVSRAARSTKLTRPLVRYDSLAIETLLELKLREGIGRHGGDVNAPVTFGSLERVMSGGTAPGRAIGLYVVVLDATAGRPVPFCAEFTPDLAVAPAVVASCAIPFAFSPRYAQVDALATGGLGSWPPFRRFVDGGAWANFPAFVFSDPSFRAYHELRDRPGRILGFTLTDPNVAAPLLRLVEDPYRHLGLDALPLMKPYPRSQTRCDEHPDPDNPGQFQYEEVRVEQSPFREKAVQIAGAASLGILQLVLLGTVLLLFGLGGRLLVTGSVLGRISGAGIVIMGLCIALLLAAVRRAAVALSREGVATLRSVLGQATAPPVWVGGVKGSAVVFVSAPGIRTTDFNAKEPVVSCAVGLAKQSTASQLKVLLDTGETAFSFGRTKFAEVAASNAATLALDLEDSGAFLRDRVPTHRTPMPSVGSLPSIAVQPPADPPQ